MPRPQAFAPSNPGFFGPIASVALRHGNTVYTSGLVGIDFQTARPVSETDFEAQVRKALDNLKEVLESAGSSLDRVLSVRCWVSDWANWEAMNAIYVTYFTHDPCRCAPRSNPACSRRTCSRSRPSRTSTSRAWRRAAGERTRQPPRYMRRTAGSTRSAAAGAA